MSEDKKPHFAIGQSAVNKFNVYVDGVMAKVDSREKADAMIAEA